MRLRYTAVAVSRSYTNSRPSLVTTYTRPYFSLICGDARWIRFVGGGDTQGHERRRVSCGAVWCGGS
jgi:hypothetical protein